MLNITSNINIQYLPLLVCGFANLNVILITAFSNHTYLVDYKLNPNPDAIHYVVLGNNILIHHEYSRNFEAPYVSDIFRTPGYPLFAGLCILLGGPLLLYTAQASLHIMICRFIYLMAKNSSSSHVPLIASSIIAVHPTLLILNIQAMSETLFIFTLCLAVLLLQRLLEKSNLLPSWRYLAPGLIIGTAILVRPAGLPLPLLTATVLLIVLSRRFGIIYSTKAASFFLIGVSTILLPWMLRNKIVFDRFVLTTNDTVVLIYFTGAGAYQIEHGIDREQASVMISREFHIHPPEDMWNYHTRNLSPVTLDSEAREVIHPVLVRYPNSLVKSCFYGLVKSIISHDADSLASILAIQPWSSPGNVDLLYFRHQSWNRLFANSSLLLAFFFIQLSINFTLLIFLPFGVIIICIQRKFIHILPIVMLIYTSFVCAASGLDAHSRFSSSILPFLSIVSSHGIHWILRLK